MFRFGEHSCELNIDFANLNINFLNFLKWGYLQVEHFFSTVCTNRNLISLNITNQVIYIPFILFSDICFNFCSQSFVLNFALPTPMSCIFFCESSFLFQVLTIRLRKLKGYQTSRMTKTWSQTPSDRQTGGDSANLKCQCLARISTLPHGYKYMVIVTNT